MSKFPVVRDLQVDRQRMFDNLIQIKGWTPLDGAFHHQEVVISERKFTDHELEQIKLDAVIFNPETKTIKEAGSYITRDLAPQQPPKKADLRYTLSECMTCGSCVEACPQVKNTPNAFIGAAIISQARYFNLHPQGEYLKEDRVEALMEDNGLANCGNAQICVKVCPKHIPLTESIVDMMGEATSRAFWGWLKK
ncbi:4Fe-4S dicluster domain-containing protein [bacterium]|nr:4Fe-4S dicluster domain-containing protein [bacterium]